MAAAKQTNKIKPGISFPYNITTYNRKYDYTKHIVLFVYKYNKYITIQ